jgi:hypothetical protein
MRRPVAVAVIVAALGALLSGGPAAAEVVELQVAWLIDGYTFEPGDRSPRGTIAYSAETNSFSGTYVGLKLPSDRTRAACLALRHEQQEGSAPRSGGLQVGHDW